MRFFQGGPKPSMAPSKPSTMILVLAALTAAYLGVAVYFATFHAIEHGGTELWLAAAAALAMLGIASQIRWSGGAALILALSFIAQLAWAGWVDPQPLGDLGAFWDEARRFAASLRRGEADWTLLHASRQPSAAFLYGVSIFAFGEDLSTLRALTAAVWTVQTWLVWRVASEVSELKPRAFACALAFGLSPTLVIFGGLPSVEALYGLFTLGAIYMMLSHRRRGLALSAAASGALVALAYLARPAGIGYLVGLAFVLAIGFASAPGWIQRGRMVGAAFACAAGFLLGVAPQAALNYAVEGRPSIAPGPAIGYELLLGTDRRGDGVAALSAEADAIEAAAARSGAPNEEAAALRAADRRARDIAVDRIEADPLGFAVFAMTEKMRRLWSSEQEMLSWSFSSPVAERSPLLQSELGRLAPSIVGGAYLALIVAAAAGALRLVLRRGAVRDPTRWVLFYVAFLSIAAAFAFGEALERRHLAFTPLLALLAPLPFARLPEVADTSFRARLAAAAAADAPQDQAAEPPRALPAPARPDVAAGAGAASAGDAKTDGAPETPAAAETPSADWSVEQKLAHVLRSMSKPPRPDDSSDDEDKAVGERA